MLLDLPPGPGVSVVPQIFPSQPGEGVLEPQMEEVMTSKLRTCDWMARGWQRHG